MEEQVIDFGEAVEIRRAAHILCASTGLMVYLKPLEAHERESLLEKIEANKTEPGAAVRNLVLQHVARGNEQATTLSEGFVEAIRSVSPSEIENVYKNACAFNNLPYYQTKPTKK